MSHKPYLRVSTLILPHERDAYAAYRMQPKKEACAALYQTLRENMPLLEQAAKVPNFRRKQGHPGIAVRLYLDFIDEYRDVIGFIFLEHYRTCIADLVKEALLFGTVTWNAAMEKTWLMQIGPRPFRSPCRGKPQPDTMFQGEDLDTLALIMEEDLAEPVHGAPFFYGSMRFDWFATPLSNYPRILHQKPAFRLLEQFIQKFGPSSLESTEQDGPHETY